MPFGIIGRTGPGTRQIAGCGDRYNDTGCKMYNILKHLALSVTNIDFNQYL